MDVYGISLLTGTVGLGVMALGGVSHGGAGGHAGHAGHVGHAGGDAGAAGHAHAGTAQAHHGSGHEAGFQLQSLLSPRLLFSVLVGFGAGGLLASSLDAPWRAAAAVLAAVLFESLVFGPLWRLLFRFESTPAVTLESSIEDEARAVMGFDASGSGLVALDVDGQVVQLLATLSADDRARGVRVRQGDVLRVESVDAARNRCTVRLNDR